MTDASIAFLGLGRLGPPVAPSLVEAGHTLCVWNSHGIRRAAGRQRRDVERPADAVTPGGVLVTLALFRGCGPGRCVSTTIVEILLSPLETATAS